MTLNVGQNELTQESSSSGDFETDQFPPPNIDNMSPALRELLAVKPSTDKKSSVSDDSAKGLRKIRKICRKESSRSLKLSSIEMTDGQLWLVPTDKSDAYRCQKGSTINYLKQRDEYFREVFTEFDQLRSFIRMCTKNQIDVSLDLDKLRDYLHKKAGSAGVSDDDYKQIKKLNKWSVTTLSPYMKSDISESRLRHLCREHEDSVDAHCEWCPVNSFDIELELFFRARRLDRELFCDAQRLLNGDTTIIDSYVSTWSKKLDLKSEMELTILKNAIARCFYNFVYLFNPGVLIDVMHTDELVAKCHFISSFSPRVLGLSEKLFTVQQMDTPMVRLVKDHKIMSEISSDFSSLQFYVCPTDIMYILQGVMHKIDEFAKANALERKFGQFVKMVEGDSSMRRKFEFMSFDDCFSLFFTILAVDPPRNALVLCDWLDAAPDLAPSSSSLKYAKATFISAVQHIMSFTEDNLIQKFINQDEHDDPLGVGNM